MHFIKDNSNFCKKLAPQWKHYRDSKAHVMVSEYLEDTYLELTKFFNSLDWQHILEDEDRDSQEVFSTLLATTE